MWTCDIELVNDQWLDGDKKKEVGNGAHIYSTYIYIFFLHKTIAINEKLPPTRWSLVLEPIKIIIRSSSPEKAPQPNSSRGGGITQTPCVFLNAPVCVCVCVCATVLASVQLGGFGGQQERWEGPSARCLGMRGEKVTRQCRFDKCTDILNKT